MEGQAVSDLEKSLVTCMCWWKFWFSRSACKDSLSQNQEQGSRVEGPGGPVASLPSLGPCMECPGALLESGELPAPMVGNASVWISVSAAGQRGSAPHLPDPQVQRCSRSDSSLPWQQWEWQTPACVPWQPGGLGIAHFWNACKFKFWTDTFGRQRRTACPERWQRCAFKLMHSH